MTDITDDVIDQIVEYAQDGNWPEFDNSIEQLRTELQRQRERQAVAVPDGWKLIPWNYTTLFNAIAAATKSQQKGVAVEVSVKAFQEAMLSAAPPADTWNQAAGTLTINEHGEYSFELPYFLDSDDAYIEWVAGLGEGTHKLFIGPSNEDMRKVLEYAPIVSKYHTVRGFELEVFLRDYDEWMEFRRQALANNGDCPHPIVEERVVSKAVQF
jgi:hypothetical protein